MKELINALQQINATLRKISHRLADIEENTRKQDAE